MTLHEKLVHAICEWDRATRNQSPYAASLALARLAEVEAEIASGKSVARALYDGFCDRLLTRLEKAAGVPVTYGGGARSTGRPD
jgi:hypothetical protein